MFWLHYTAKMAKWIELMPNMQLTTCSISASGQTKDFKIGIHSFPASRSALKR